VAAIADAQIEIDLEDRASLAGEDLRPCKSAIKDRLGNRLARSQDRNG
jgi:hypothetical protein